MYEDLNIPDFLLAKNRVPLSPERQQQVDLWLSQASFTEEKRDWNRPRSWDADTQAVFEEVEAGKAAALAETRRKAYVFFEERAKEQAEIKAVKQAAREAARQRTKRG